MPVKEEAYAEWPSEDLPVRLPWQLDTELAGFDGGAHDFDTRLWHAASSVA
jgi:hypothetical protein